jgi:Bacterial Ig domain
MPTAGVRRVEVTAEAFDPDGDAMSFKWTAPAGHFANPLAQHTEFTCPSAPATVPVTIAVTDANGAVARETITVHCVDQAR